MIQYIQKFAAHFVAVALMALNLSLPSAAFAGKQAVPGQLTVNGEVSVNGKKAITGSSVFDGSRLNVACASGASAIVNLGKLGRMQLSPGTEMIVRFSEGIISGELLSGKAIVNNATGVKVSIATPEGMSSADGKEASTLAVATQKGTRCVPMAGKSGGSSSGGSSGGSGGGWSSASVAAVAVGAGGATAAGIAAAVGRKGGDFNASYTLP
ncbi:MAG: hypothetical protein HOP19_02115 [Acidobacteria bacterium]|nr:hypothetical protein [Acidobacteriota bacterium]